jgi:YnbE-like lipoprotein
MTRSRLLHAACGSALMLPLAGCISVSSPEKPIEINLNVTIKQEVLVRLQRDVEQLIQENPEAFPQPQPQPQKQ